MSNTPQNPKNDNLQFNTNYDPNNIQNQSRNAEEFENDILNQIINETDNNVYTAVNSPLFNETPNETQQNTKQQENINEIDLPTTEPVYTPSFEEQIDKIEKIEQTQKEEIQQPIQTIQTEQTQPIKQTEQIESTEQIQQVPQIQQVETPTEIEDEIPELQNPIINTSIQEPTINTINLGSSPKDSTLLNGNIADNLFSFFAKLGLPILLLLSLLLCGQQILFPRDFWFAEEVRFADIYMNMLSSNNFLMLTLNGQPYAETGPLYYYLVRFIDLIPAINMPQALLITTVLCFMLFTTSTWILTRGLGYSNNVAFGAGLITISCLAFASLSYYIRMDLLFVSLLNFSYFCFYRAWKKENAPIWLIFAFLFLALACLAQTLFFFILPFLASLCFFFWTGKLKRINSADGIIGFLLAMLIFFAWFGYIYMQGKADYISLILNQQILEFFALPNFSTINVYYFLLILPLAFLPFTFSFLFADWINWLKNIGTSIKNRKQDNATAWIFILFLCHLLLFIFFGQSLSSIIAILALFSILSAKIIINFSELRGKLFFTLTAIFTLFLGISLILSEFQTYIFKFIPFAQDFVTKIPFVLFEANAHTSYGFATIGIILSILGLFLFIINKKNTAGGTLLLYTIGIIIAVQPITLLVTPQISSVLSPKTYAYEMANQHKTQNVTPVTLGIPANIFTYYYNEGLDPENYQGKTISELPNIDALTDFLLSNETIILAIPEQEFKQISYKEEAIVLPYHQYIGTQKILLTLWQISSQTSLLNAKKEKEVIPLIDNLLEPKEKDAIINVQPNKKQEPQETPTPNTMEQFPTDQSPTTNNQDEIAL